MANERVKQYIVKNEDTQTIFAIPYKSFIERLRDQVRSLKEGETVEFSNGTKIERTKVYPESERQHIYKYGDGRVYQTGIRLWINGDYKGEFGFGKLKKNKKLENIS